jgi:hypothetical protein
MLHDVEGMRSAAGFPSPLVSYFMNNSLNEHPGLSSCMESVAEKVNVLSIFIRFLSLYFVRSYAIQLTI